MRQIADRFPAAHRINLILAAFLLLIALFSGGSSQESGVGVLARERKPSGLVLMNTFTSIAAMASRFLVPTANLAYVELGAEAERRVGFVA